MAQRDTPPFRADHVGSLLRPPELLRVRGLRRGPRVRGRAARSAENDAIQAAVRMQQSVGLQAATDGELRRGSSHMDLVYQLDGVTGAPGELTVQFRNAEGTVEFTPAAMRVDGRLGVSHTIFGDDFSMLRDAVTSATPKLTIPTPSMVHYRGGRAAIDPDVYPDLERFWTDLAAAVGEGQIVLACDLVTETNDRHQLVPMLEATKETLAAVTDACEIGVVLADAGYCGWGLLVVEEQWFPGVAEMPGEVVGGRAEEDVCSDAVFEAVVDRA